MVLLCNCFCQVKKENVQYYKNYAGAYLEPAINVLRYILSNVK